MTGSKSMSRPWDAYDVYLFDVDGTLLNCNDAVHYFAFCEALTGIAGRPLNLDGIVAHGNTDVGILRDVLALHQVDDARWRPRLHEIRSGMCQFFDDHKSEIRASALPGAARVLEHLQQRGALLAVATGNLERIGWAKLEHCGLREYFHVGGFSDAFEYRRDVFRAAVETARELTHAGASICVFGDTPADIHAARDNGLDIIAVATGEFSFEILKSKSPDLCIRSLDQLLTGRGVEAGCEAPGES